SSHTSISALFRRGDRIGIALHCGTEVTRLVTVAATGADAQTLATTVQPIASAAWYSDVNTGFVARQHDDCWGLGKVAEGGVVAFKAPIPAPEGGMSVEAN